MACDGGTYRPHPNDAIGAGASQYIDIHRYVGIASRIENCLRMRVCVSKGDARLVEVPRPITIHQGDDMGRPSVITVSIPSTGGIVVTGTAANIE